VENICASRPFSIVKPPVWSSTSFNSIGKDGSNNLYSFASSIAFNNRPTPAQPKIFRGFVRACVCGAHFNPKRSGASPPQ
jgi:hypothetical protein